jgi:hypothetical protein
LDFWRKIIPSRTYTSKEEKTMPKLKALKERLTLLLGANAARKFNLKPLLMYRYENPRHLLPS